MNVFKHEFKHESMDTHTTRTLKWSEETSPVTHCFVGLILPYRGSSSGPFQEPKTFTYYAENLQPM